MSVLSREEFINSVNAFVGDNSSDDALKFIEDMSDTYTSMEALTSETADWKQKYEENDKLWREKYRARFMGAKTSDDDDLHEDKTGCNIYEQNSSLIFDDLFTKGK